MRRTTHLHESLRKRNINVGRFAKSPDATLSMRNFVRIYLYMVPIENVRYWYGLRWRQSLSFSYSRQMVRYDFGRQVDHCRPCARGQRPPEPSHPHSEETPEEKRDASWVGRVERARMVMHGSCAPKCIESIRALRGDTRFCARTQLRTVKNGWSESNLEYRNGERERNRNFHQIYFTSSITRYFITDATDLVPRD